MDEEPADPQLPSGVRRLGDFALRPRSIVITAAAVPLGALSAVVAYALLRLIGLITNLIFYQRLNTRLVAPGAHHNQGWVVLLAPVVGGLIVGLMARYGSEKIRGHGMPEAIESILVGGSRVAPRVALLKPISAALAIGTGGPFGAEGPIIMTGGAFGSLLAQFFELTADERKTLLVAGAAGGMAATFNAPLASVLLAVELLLFEWRPRSFIPVAAAVAAATITRGPLLGTHPIFAVHATLHLHLSVYLLCVVAGLLGGLLAVLATVLVYASEDGFGRLPIHWMWWPAIGGLIVGVGGLIEPRALGVGYDVIRELLRGQAPLSLIIGILVVKTLIWSLSLGSGTSGGVLAPTFMIGGALGALEAQVFPHVAGGFWSLVGLAAVVGGVMRSPLTGIVFSLELTHEWGALLPLMIASSAAYALSVLILKRSVLTEKIARRDMHLTREYTIDPLEVLFVRDVMSRETVRFHALTPLAEAAAGFVSGQRQARDRHHRQRLYPVLDEQDRLVGVITRREMLDAALAPVAGDAVVGDRMLGEPVVAYPDLTLREAANLMAERGVTRVPVVDREHPERLHGIVTLADLLAARLVDLEEDRVTQRILRIRRANRVRPQTSAAEDPVGTPARR
ncbi:MAG TPA: chloride channel protein [Solirubrobacteraceae bacterium]|nr:chloride channel protein [Solirubrobacteraceae bacterium]